MITALVFAGGTGKRMNSKSKPKQFLELYGKPIIIYTLEHFEKHEKIDNIAVVCIKECIDLLKEYLQRYNITKVRWIVNGGATGQESIYNGLNAIHSDVGESKNNIVLVHDGVRPFINHQIISDVIKSVEEYGSGITVSDAKETIVNVDKDNNIVDIRNREYEKIARAPQGFYLKEIWDAHNMAIKEGITNVVDSATLMQYYGKSLHMVKGPDENIKITTPSDFYIFRAIYEAKENSQIFGL